MYRDEKTVVYTAPKPEKILFTEEDLYKSDVFTFGSIIGAITNKSTSGFALLNDLELKYGKDSREYETTIKRIKMCTKLQSAQIDKAKIGRNVKGIPKTWTDRKYIDSLDIPIEEKEFLKSIMLDKHPYFFIYLYPDTRKKYKKYIEEKENYCRRKFISTVEELKRKENKSIEEVRFLNDYEEFMPVIYGDSVMNNICRYLEGVNFDIKNKIKGNNNDEIYKELLSNKTKCDNNLYEIILNEYLLFKKQIMQLSRVRSNVVKNKYTENVEQQLSNINEIFKNKMDGVCSNSQELVDNLIRVFYIDCKSDNKDLLWNNYGNIIFNNIKNNKTEATYFPFKDKNGEIEYLNQRFALREVEVC